MSCVHVLDFDGIFQWIMILTMVSLIEALRLWTFFLCRLHPEKQYMLEINEETKFQPGKSPFWCLKDQNNHKLHK